MISKGIGAEGLCLLLIIQAHPITIPGATWLANILNGIFHTSVAVGGITAGILDNIIPGTDKERGVCIR